ncbi:MAG TPA: acetolactate synthase small subunit [Armatimonadota bacterium]|nr:acetolactate synthase small subunit [Armatimonadota bacterium]HOS43374.1 acetolactate synthase small subunit [Armatimonadota bacterium]
MKHTISVLVENRPGVLARTAGLFSRRGFNIDSLTVSTTEDPHTSRMTIVVDGPAAILEQIGKQLYKLVDVIKVMDHTEDHIVSRELALVKVHAADSVKRAELMQIVDIFRAKIVDLGDKTIIIEATGASDKIDALERLLEGYGIKEMVRSGRVVLVRGSRTT